MLAYLMTFHIIIYFLVLSIKIIFLLLIWIVELRVMKVHGIHYFKTSVEITINIVHWHLVKITYLLEILVNCRAILLKIHFYDFRFTLERRIFKINIKIL